MSSLFGLKGINQGQRFALDKDVVVIGRSPECDLALPATSISRQHARLLRVQGKWYLEDMQSRNGTFVNGQGIKTRTLLKHNDRIRICDFVAAFHDSVLSTMPDELVSDLSEVQGSTAHETSSGHSSKILANQPAENLKVILQISNYLVKTLELDQLLPRIVDSLFQLFKQADRCFLIVDDGHGKLSPLAIRTRQPEEALTADYSHSIVMKCLESAEAFLTEDTGDDVRLRESESVAGWKPRSVMCVPLSSAEGQAFGVIQIDTPSRQKKFTQDDLNLLWGVANQISIALQMARMHEDLLEHEQRERDLEVAGQVQRSLLPEQLPEIIGYDFFAHYAAALTVGGDYYDFIPLPNQRLAITVGDVAGKGVPAALLMARLSSEMRMALLTEAELAGSVARLNEVLFPHTYRTHRFVTLAAAILDPIQQTATVINAGHLPPLLYRHATGTLEEAIPRSLAGTVLGMDQGLTFQSSQVALNPGDCLLLFTDGVCEAVNIKKKYQILDGIYAIVHGGGPYSPRTLGERLVKAVEQHATRGSPQDDVTLVCFGRKV